MATVLEHTLELRPETVARLRAVAALVDGDPRQIALEGIERFLDDIEDVSALSANRHENAQGPRVSLEQLKADLALDD